MTNLVIRKTTITGCNTKNRCSGGSPGSRAGMTAVRLAPLGPGSRERRASRLRLLPPGPGQVRPTDDPTPPYGSGGDQPSAPRGKPSTGDGAPYGPLPPLPQGC